MGLGSGIQAGEAMSDKCKECGADLVNTPSGQFSTCPNGHGKLMPPIMPKPFDTLDVPLSIAVCPECGGFVEVECNEWTLVNGVSKPTQGGLLIYCASNTPWGFDHEIDEEDEHNYAQHLWIDIHMKVYKWLEAVE
jgi:hypothetical protein